MESKAVVSKEDIEKVARLARINLSNQEQEKLARDLSGILDHFKDLQNIETSQVFAQKVKYQIADKNVLREDQVGNVSEEEKENIRKLFPQRTNGFLKVKKVL